MKTKLELIKWLEENKEPFIELSDRIWANPEIGMKEFKASKWQADFLEKVGFHITWDIGGMNTAFMAEWGEGKPVIGFAGEYDALLALSQKAQPDPEPLEKDGLGHGCGHNLLGVGCLAAAVAVKEWLEDTGKSGTVKYFGCPGEEDGDGKVFMARDGVFNDLDATFNYHPSYINSASKGSCVGNRDILFKFHGKTAHAGGSPHLGRSALDAVELMNVGVNYLREHVTEKVRMHYTITHGGDLPNVVPAEAEVWYFLRAHENAEMEQLVERVSKIARGAALMTETECEIIFQGGCSKVVSNYHLADLQTKAMKLIGPIEFTDEEMAFAQTINDNFGFGSGYGILESEISEKLRPLIEPYKDVPLWGVNLPPYDEGKVETGSTDVGDMSQVVPVSMLSTACWPVGAPGHSWGITAVGGMSIGHKGMMHAAKIMAAAALDLYSDPAQLQKVLEEFEKEMKANPYLSPFSDEMKPRQYPNPERD